MRNSQSWIAVLALIAAATVVVLTFTAATDPATGTLPGITSKDDKPNGCVDCHKVGADKKDRRLNVALAAVEDHPDVTKMVKKLPADCGLCHKEGSKAGALSAVLHAAHYSDPSKNAFVSVYKGVCLSCHVYDAKSGSMGMKSGAANW